MTVYFDDFKSSMKRRMRILVSLVEKHEKYIFILVDIDYTYIQVVIPRVRWLRPLGYELDVDQASTAIISLLAKETDKSTKHFGTYDVVKSRVVTDLKTDSVMNRKDKLVKKIKKKFGAELGEEGTIEEAEETSDDNGDKGEDEPDQGPPQLTQGLGEDKDESAKEEQVEEAPIKAKVIKRKDKEPLAP